MTRVNSRPARVLITDDEEDVRWMLATIMKGEGFESLEAADGARALELVRQKKPDAMILDLQMPGMDGLEVLRHARQLSARLPVIMLSGYGTPESAVDAGKFGAQAFLTKPFKNDELVFTLRLALHCKSHARLPDGPHRHNGHEPLGQSDEIRRVVSEVERVAPTDFTVVISGETGVGKEVVAHLIHELSPRAAGPFVALDCGAIPPTLIESELFGHEKGAFTGADRYRSGSFEAAADGTLFLDEIGNLPLAMQTKLLRALQERQIQRVGGRTPVQFDVRVLAATNEDLADMIKTGRFRQDLYYRLNEYGIAVPPLRERGQDVAYLARRFLEETRAELHKDVQGFSARALEKLQSYRWPGNVRELRNVVRRAVLLADTWIDLQHLDIASAAPLPGSVDSRMENSTGSFKEIIRQSVMETERGILLRVLRQTGGNMARAARMLKVDYKTVRTKAKQYHLSDQET